MHSYARCCIVGSSLTEDFFLQEDGVFLLLDLLEVNWLIILYHKVYFMRSSTIYNTFYCIFQACPNSLQNIVLGTVLELCENKKVRIDNSLKLLL